MASIHGIVFDCARPSALARFWADALGYQIRAYDEAEIARLRALGIDNVADDPTVVVDPPTPGLPSLWFVKVPESKRVKNRLHLDLRSELSMDDEVARLVGLGARGSIGATTASRPGPSSRTPRATSFAWSGPDWRYDPERRSTVAVEQPIVADPPGFASLPKAEQIEYLQNLWDRVASEPPNLPAPASHLELVDQRLSDYRAGLSVTRDAYKILDELEQSLD